MKKTNIMPPSAAQSRELSLADLETVVGGVSTLTSISIFRPAPTLPAFQIVLFPKPRPPIPDPGPIEIQLTR